MSTSASSGERPVTLGMLESGLLTILGAPNRRLNQKLTKPTRSRGVNEAVGNMCLQLTPKKYSRGPTAQRASLGNTAGALTFQALFREVPDDMKTTSNGLIKDPSVVGGFRRSNFSRRQSDSAGSMNGGAERAPRLSETSRRTSGSRYQIESVAGRMSEDAGFGGPPDQGMMRRHSTGAAQFAAQRAPRQSEGSAAHDGRRRSMVASPGLAGTGDFSGPGTLPHMQRRNSRGPGSYGDPAGDFARRSWGDGVAPMSATSTAEVLARRKSIASEMRAVLGSPTLDASRIGASRPGRRNSRGAV